MKQKRCYIRFGGSRVLKDLQASCCISGAIKRAFSRICMLQNSGGKRLISSVLTSNSARSLFCSISHPDASEILPCFKHTSLPLECASCQKCGLAPCVGESRSGVRYRYGNLSRRASPIRRRLQRLVPRFARLLVAGSHGRRSSCQHPRGDSGVRGGCGGVGARLRKPHRRGCRSVAGS